MHSAHRLKEGAAFVDDHRVDVVPVTEARWELETVGRLRGEGGDGAHNSRGQQGRPSGPPDPRPPGAVSDSIFAAVAYPDAAHGAAPVITTVSHFRAENAVGVSNWLLMFSTSWPSFSVSATTMAHSGSARKALQRFSRSAKLSQASM